MSKLGERVQSARVSKGLSQKQVASMAGIDQPVVAKVEGGTTVAPRAWRALADALDIPRDEFRALMVDATREAGKTTRLPSAVKSALSEQLSVPSNARYAGTLPPQGNRRDVPVFGRASAGNSGEFEFGGETLGWEFRPPQLDGVMAAYAVYVSGDSMYPRYKDGETLFVNPNRPAAIGDDVVVQLHPKDEVSPPSGFVKELRSFKGDKLVLWQHNPPKELKFDRSRVGSVHVVEFVARR